jgi:hypothetical protein
MQISSAPRIRFGELDGEARRAAVAQLTEMAEDRYLHQSTIAAADGTLRFFDDLPDALAAIGDGADFTGDICIHFHIPVYLDRFGAIEATQNEIRQSIAGALEFADCKHLEVETYAWDVLPPGLRQDDLAAGIAHELRWFADEFARIRASRPGESAPTRRDAKTAS